MTGIIDQMTTGMDAERLSDMELLDQRIAETTALLEGMRRTREELSRLSDDKTVDRVLSDMDGRQETGDRRQEAGGRRRETGDREDRQADEMEAHLAGDPTTGDRWDGLA